MSLSGTLSSHFWTVAPRVRQLWGRAGDQRKGDPRAAPWRARVADDRWGEVAIGGLLDAAPGARDAVVAVHGLGGSTASHYLGSLPRICRSLGVSCLRLDLRGSDLSGEDLYHAGLTADLAAAMASPELAAYDRIHLVGFSLGGHIALRYATESPDARLRAVAAVCAPLDLAPAQRAFDLPSAWPYRRYVLGRLKRIYAATARRRELAHPLARVLRCERIREWDELTVVPRFGFRDADDYYATASVGPRLARLAVPALLVAARRDPLVGQAAVERAAAACGDALAVHWVERAGHVGFPQGLRLGEEGPPGLEGQLLAWLLRH